MNKKKFLTEKHQATKKLLALTEQEDCISCSMGLPESDVFPIDNIIDSTQHILKTAGRKALQYSPTGGLTEARTAIAKYESKKFTCELTADNVVLTSGSQQSLDLIGRTFIATGDSVALETPNYFGTINALHPYKPNFCELNWQNNIPVMDTVTPDPHILYMQTHFYNPTGKSLTNEQKNGIGVTASKVQYFAN